LYNDEWVVSQIRFADQLFLKIDEITNMQSVVDQEL